MTEECEGASGEPATKAELPAVAAEDYVRAALAVSRDDLEKFVRRVQALTGTDIETAHDIAQDVALRLLISGVALPTEADFERYVRTTVRNTAIDRARRAARDAARQTKVAPLLPTDTIPGDLSDVLAREEGWRDVFEDLRQMPSEQREALELRYLDGLTQREIAQRIGTDVRVVEYRLREGTRRLAAGERRRRAAGAWLLVLVHALRERERAAVGAVDVVALGPASLVVVGATALALVGGLVPSTPRAPANVRTRLAAPGYAQRSGGIPGGGGPGPAVHPVRGAGGVRAPHTGTSGSDQATRPLAGAIPPLPVEPPTVTPCAARCTPERYTGDVVTVVVLGQDGPSVAEDVTPICHTVPATPVFECRRGQEPERWRVKELAPQPVTNGATP